MALPSFEKPTRKTSERMQKVKTKGTNIEKAMRKLLKAEGILYRSQPKIRGNPDFRIVGEKVVIFCDSSFWHGRWVNTPKAERFYRNQEFWQKKLEANKRKDRIVSINMKKRGWKVLRFWDDEILKSPKRVLRKIKRTSSINGSL